MNIDRVRGFIYDHNHSKENNHATSTKTLIHYGERIRSRDCISSPSHHTATKTTSDAAIHAQHRLEGAK